MIEFLARSVAGAVTLAIGLSTGGAPAVDEARGEQRSAAAVFDVPSVRLAPLKGHEGESARTSSAASRANELAVQASETTDPQLRASLLLHAANIVLAHELEPACTAKLLGFSSSQLPVTEAQVQDALDRVDAVLIRADSALDDVRANSPPPEEWLEATSQRLTTLGAFAHGLRALLLQDDAAGLEASQRAGSRLAALLEHSRPDVAAAANLWQSSLRARDSDPSRALATLGLALSEPERTAMPYVFFGKLLRCQILASHGGQVTALALLTQLEEMADLWFDDAEDRAGAVRAITFVEINVLRAWHDGMPAAPDSPERAWCVERAEKLIAERFAEEAPTLLRLSDAIPIITSPKDTGPVQIEKGTVED